MSGEGWLKKSGVLEKWKPLTDKKENASAKEFAEASLALISVFDLIPGMGMASGDMSKNATTILKAGEADPAKTLAALVDAELAGADPKKMGKIAGDGKTVSCALLWLGRALCFVIKLMDVLMKEKGKKLSDCVLAGYEVSLKPHHGMIIKGTFNVAVKAAPNRDDFIKKLGDSEDEVFKALGEVWPQLTTCVEGVQGYLSKKDATAFKP